MIKEVIMYTVICDGCGKDSNYDSEYSAWSDKGYAVDCAVNADFIERSEESAGQLAAAAQPQGKGRHGGALPS